MRKLFLIIIFLFVPLFLFSKEEIRSRRFKHNNIDYVVFYSNEKSFSMSNMNDFFTFFESRLQKLCFQFNTRMPNSLRVNVIMGAWIFKSLTGKDRYVAGIFDPEQRMFFFQDPASLKRKGILNRVVSHEILHYIIYRNRKKQRTPGYWMEEVFCESLFPSKDYTSSYINIPVKGIPSYFRLKQFISTGVVAKHMDERKRAYYAAYLWGTYLMGKLGKDYLFQVCVGGVREVELKKFFIGFRNHLTK